MSQDPKSGHLSGARQKQKATVCKHTPPFEPHLSHPSVFFRMHHTPSVFSLISRAAEFLALAELHTALSDPEGLVALCRWMASESPHLSDANVEGVADAFRRIGRGTDLWFQTAQGRGSRVLLRTSMCRGLSRSSRECMETAADLAAYFSDVWNVMDWTNFTLFFLVYLFVLQEESLVTRDAKEGTCAKSALCREAGTPGAAPRTMSAAWLHEKRDALVVATALHSTARRRVIAQPKGSDRPLQTHLHKPRSDAPAAAEKAH